MFYPRFANSRLHRQTILASVAVASLAVAGAFGEAALTSSHPAQAAAVSIADLPHKRRVVRASHRARQSGGGVGEGQDGRRR